MKLAVRHSPRQAPPHSCWPPQARQRGPGPRQRVLLDRGQRGARREHRRQQLRAALHGPRY